MHAGFPLLCIFMHMGLHHFYYTGEGLGVKIYNNFKGGVGLKYVKHRRFTEVAECLVQTKLTPYCKTEI